LRHEINRLIEELGIKSALDLAIKYPNLLELKQNLEQELSDDGRF
jgi:hypothetical protein